MFLQLFLHIRQLFHHEFEAVPEQVRKREGVEARDGIDTLLVELLSGVAAAEAGGLISPSSVPPGVPSTPRPPLPVGQQLQMFVEGPNEARVKELAGPLRERGQQHVLALLLANEGNPAAALRLWMVLPCNVLLLWMVAPVTLCSFGWYCPVTLRLWKVPHCKAPLLWAFAVNSSRRCGIKRVHVCIPLHARVRTCLGLLSLPEMWERGEKPQVRLHPACCCLKDPLVGWSDPQAAWETLDH